MTVLRLEHLDVRVVAIEAHRSLGPLTADRAAADDRENEISENFKVAPGDTDVLELDRACGECYRDDRLPDPDALKSSDLAANG